MGGDFFGAASAPTRTGMPDKVRAEDISGLRDPEYRVPEVVPTFRPDSPDQVRVKASTGLRNAVYNRRRGVSAARLDTLAALAPISGCGNLDQRVEGA